MHKDDRPPLKEVWYPYVRAVLTPPSVSTAKIINPNRHCFLLTRGKVKIVEDLERSRSEFSESSNILTFHRGNK